MSKDSFQRVRIIYWSGPSLSAYARKHFSEGFGTYICLGLRCPHMPGNTFPKGSAHIFVSAFAVHIRQKTVSAWCCIYIDLYLRYPHMRDTFSQGAAHILILAFTYARRHVSRFCSAFLDLGLRCLYMLEDTFPHAA